MWFSHDNEHPYRVASYFPFFFFGGFIIGMSGIISILGRGIVLGLFFILGIAYSPL